MTLKLGQIFRTAIGVEVRVHSMNTWRISGQITKPTALSGSFDGHAYSHWKAREFRLWTLDGKYYRDNYLEAHPMDRWDVDPTDYGLEPE